MTDTPTTAIEALLAVQSDLEAIGKDRNPNDGVKFKYRGIDDVINALHPLFVKHGVILSPKVIDQQCDQHKHGLLVRLTVQYDALTAHGTVPKVAVGVGYGVDSRDKAPGIAMSYAYKSAVSQLFSLPTDDPSMDAEHRNDPVGEPVDMNRVGRMFAAYQLLPETGQQALASWLKTPVIDLAFMVGLHPTDLDRLELAIGEWAAVHAARHGETPETGHTADDEESPF